MHSSITLKRVTSAASPVDGRKVAPSSERATAGLHISASDVQLVRELALYAADSVERTIREEEAYGNRAPILLALKRYKDDATALLKRLA